MIFAILFMIMACIFVVSHFTHLLGNIVSQALIILSPIIFSGSMSVCTLVSLSAELSVCTSGNCLPVSYGTILGAGSM